MSEPQQPYGPPPGYGTPGYGQQPAPDAVPGWPPAGSPAPQASGWGAPAPYGPGAPYSGPTETSSRAIVALVLAIGSFVVLPFFAAVAALFVASSAHREIDQAGGRLDGRGMATAAKVVAWINIALCVAGVLLFVGIIALFAASGASTV